MRQRHFLFTLLLGSLLTLPAWAQAPDHLKYFGYVGGGDDDQSLNTTKGFTNFAHFGASQDLTNPFVRTRVAAVVQKGLKATIDLGGVFWCDYDQNFSFHYRCDDWLDRWQQWKTFNASILTSDKVIAVSVLDEPFSKAVNMTHYEEVVQKVVDDLDDGIKIYLHEAACVVLNQSEGCGHPAYAGSSAFANYHGTLPGVDWVTAGTGGVLPSTDPTFLNGRALMKSRFPNKEWIYVMDGFWDPMVHAARFRVDDMATVARDWYNVAKNDPRAVLLGVIFWNQAIANVIVSKDFSCTVLREHVAIGREITRKALPQTSLPLGTFAVDSNGVASGWVCDPDATVCEIPRADLYMDGVLNATPALSKLDTIAQPQCSTGFGYRFQHTLARATAGRSVTLRAQDVAAGAGTATIASTCPQSPACAWTPHLQHFGYSGAGDEDLGLNQIKGYTDFAHIATVADVNSTFVRDRVAAMSQKGIKATIDLGKLLWCGTSYTYLCSDYVTRWNTWKQTNASILTSDKVLAFAIRDEPFLNRVNIAGYEAAAHMVKTDLPWAKIFLLEAACAVRGSCFGTSHTAFSQYTGTMLDVDWVGVSEYGIYPLTNSGFKTAVQRLKTKFPGKKTVYIMDAFWDSAHVPIISQISSMKGVARDWYNVARNDFDAILLGAFTWWPMSGATTSRSFACDVMAEHVAIGREVTGKVRAQTGPPLGRLEGVYNGSVVGWACDPDGTVCENPTVNVHRAGSYYNSPAFPNRNDYVLSPQCEAGLGIRFRTTLGIGTSGYPLTAVARDLDSASTVTLPSNCLENPACLWYSSYADAKGYMQDLGTTGVAQGWVCDPDAPHLTTKVKLVANGTVIGTYTADLSSEPAVAGECGGGNNHRFSVQLPAWTRGLPVEAYSVDLTSGDFLIPWLCSDPWTDYWSCTW